MAGTGCSARLHQQPGNGLDKIVAMVRGHFDQYVKALNGVAPHFAMLTEISSLDDAHAADIKVRWQEIFGLCEKMVSRVSKKV